MGEFFSKLLELFVNGNKTSIIKILVFCLLVVFIIPYATNYFYGNIRIEQQIKILQELNSIDRNSIKDLHLQQYYDKLIKSIEEQKIQKPNISVQYTPITKIDFQDFEFIIKFLSGAIWWILLFFVGLFTKQDSIGSKIAVQIAMFILIIVFGFGGMYIPKFDPFIINIIGFPLLQIVFFVLLFILVGKLNKKKET